LLDLHDQYRHARLTAWLRTREPDDHVNFSVLVYRVSAEELRRAVDGPPPPYGPDLRGTLPVSPGSRGVLRLLGP
jgi:hypothetical protein